MDNKELVDIAIKARGKAYAPYSGFKVGACVETEDGSIYTGVNVENASLGATICAERSAVCNAVTNGHTKIKRIVVTADTDEPILPCGICRQVLSEFCDDKAVIICSNIKGDVSIKTLQEILPEAFKKYIG